VPRFDAHAYGITGSFGLTALRTSSARPPPTERLLLSHHDNWLPGFSIETDTKPIRRAVADRSPATEFVEMGYASGYPLFGSAA
jgi:hypothetical protein